MRRLFVAAVLATAACSKCGGQQATAPATGVERVLPKNATAVVIVPSVLKLGEKLKLLEGLKVANFAAQAQNFANAHELADALVAQLGIDIRSKEALDKLGIADSSSAGVAVIDDDGNTLLALPIKNEGRLGAFLRTIAANRLGASAVEDKVVGGVTVHRLMTPAGQAKLGWATSQGYALVTVEKHVDQLGAWAALPESETLAKDVSLPASLKRLPLERDAIVYVPPGSPAIAGSPVAHVALVLSLTPAAFTLTADAPWKDASALAAFEAKPGPQLLGFLPVDAFLVARYAGEPAALAPWLGPVLGPRLMHAFEEGGFDLKAQVLEKLQPGSVVGLSLAPTAQMGQGVPELDVRRTNPFRWVHLSGVAPAKSAEAIGPTLVKLTDVAPRFGAQIEKRDAVFVTTYSQGEGVHFAEKGDRVMFGSPLVRVNGLLEADGTKVGPVADPGLKQLLESSAFAAVIDLRKLSDAVRELPSSAWGIGGFAIKATTVRWLDNSDDLKAVTITAGVKQGAVQGELRLMLGAPVK